LLVLELIEGISKGTALLNPGNSLLKIEKRLEATCSGRYSLILWSGECNGYPLQRAREFHFVSVVY